MQIRFPVPSKYKDIADYFSDFVSMNEGIEGFSHRGIASALGWPVSFMSDVMARRKNVTCLRAIQFSQYARFDPIDAERLVLLAVLEPLPKVYQDLIVAKNVSDERFERLPEDLTDILYNLDILTVFEIISWADGKILVEDIVRLSATRPLTDQQVKKSVEALERKRVLRQLEDGTFELLVRHLVADERSSEMEQMRRKRQKELHQEFATNFISYLSEANCVGPSEFTSSLISLPRDRIRELADRMIALRNWILEFGIQASKNPRESLDQWLLFQLDLNLFPVINKGIAKQLSNQVGSPEPG